MAVPCINEGRIGRVEANQETLLKMFERIEKKMDEHHKDVSDKMDKQNELIHSFMLEAEKEYAKKNQVSKDMESLDQRVIGLEKSKWYQAGFLAAIVAAVEFALKFIK